jgi:acyl-CoA thioesterase-1
MIFSSWILFFTLSFADPSPNSFPPAAPTVVILGDSLTEGYGISQSQAYPAILENLLKEKKISAKIINAGISGSTSASGESRLRWFLKSRPDILVLALGANDGLRGLDTDGLKTHLEKVIRLAQAEKIKVIIAGMKIPLNYGDDYRRKYERVFPDLAKQYSLELIPFLLEGVATNKSLNISDGIHPNEKGHAVIAKNLLPVIEKSLKQLKAPHAVKN